VYDSYTVKIALIYLLSSTIFFWKMASDKNGKGKEVEKPKRKRTCEEREWDKALAVPDAHW
jgi:hypothetical protein